jgi:hypothetical protein
MFGVNSSRERQQKVDPCQVGRDRIALDAVNPLRPQPELFRRPDRIMPASAAGVQEIASPVSEIERRIDQAGRGVVGSPDRPAADEVSAWLQRSQRFLLSIGGSERKKGTPVRRAAPAAASPSPP